MPVSLDQEVINLKQLEREFKKSVRAINRDLQKEFIAYGKDLTREVYAIVRADLRSHGYSSETTERVLDGIRIRVYKGKGINVYARAEINAHSQGISNIFLGEHKERFTDAGEYRGKLKPERLDLNFIANRDQPKIQAIAERITKRVLELEVVR